MAVRRQLPDIMSEALGRLSVVPAPTRGKILPLTPGPEAQPVAAPAPPAGEPPDLEALAARLGALRLTAMARALRELSGQPAPPAPPAGPGEFGQRLAGLVAAEESQRRARLQAGRLKRAGLATAPDLDSVHCGARRGLPLALWAELVAGAWRLARRNLLICGPTGVGKTHLAQALGRAACCQGQGVLYRRLPPLAAELGAAARRGSVTGQLKRLARADLLILDDLGLARPSQAELPYLFEVIEARLGQRPTLVASLLAPEAWAAYLGGDHLAVALVDRLTAGALRLELAGDSWRGQPQN